MERWNDRRLLLLFGTDQPVESPRNLPGVIPQLVELVPISLGQVSELPREKNCVGDFRQRPERNVQEPPKLSRPSLGGTLGNVRGRGERRAAHLRGKTVELSLGKRLRCSIGGERELVTGLPRLETPVGHHGPYSDDGTPDRSHQSTAGRYRKTKGGLVSRLSFHRSNFPSFPTVVRPSLVPTTDARPSAHPGRLCTSAHPRCATGL